MSAEVVRAAYSPKPFANSVVGNRQGRFRGQWNAFTLLPLQFSQVHYCHLGSAVWAYKPCWKWSVRCSWYWDGAAVASVRPFLLAYSDT